MVSIEKNVSETAADAVNQDDVTELTELTELSEDIEVVGPGQMLADARENCKFSQEYVAQKLNFRISLVVDIEADVFDNTLPATFNRGYLCNYAKLVGISKLDILASYDALGAANMQRTEMQSFSNLVVKQTEHSRIMWVSYLIVALLIGSTIMWWVQDNQQHSGVIKHDEYKGPQEKTANEAPLNTDKKLKSNESLTRSEQVNDTAEQFKQNAQEKSQTNVDSTNVNIATVKVLKSTDNSDIKQVTTDDFPTVQATENTLDIILSTAVFTFSGDCWVNIYDATGERIAWGVKKQGYVMTVSGKAPLRVTLGKPELATIVFDGQAVDMSLYNAGNIAKFTLPVSR